MKKVLSLVSCVIALSACTDEYVGETNEELEQNKTADESATNYNEAFGRSIVLGKRLNNPYSLKNMQQAYDSLCDAGMLTRSSGELQPTHLYVRFLPKDSVDFNILDKEKLDLFCYPLDYDVEEWGDYYHDPSIPEDQPTWQYTKVPFGYKFPKIQYEVLDTCFIPEEDEEETRSGANTVYLEGLEDAAYEISGNGGMLNKSELRSKESPSGRFTVYNSYTGKYDGVSGIAVRMGKFLKWFHVHTDKNGYYSTKSTFRTDPHYWIYFTNKKGFKIGSWCVFANSRLHAMGKHSNKGYSHAFEKGSDMWAHCIVNNAAYYMYENYGSYIPSDMRIWVLDNTEKGSAAMLGHNTASKQKVIAFMGASLGLGAAAVEVLIPGLTALAPDITIGVEGKNTWQIYKQTCHELAHSMHFKKVGKSYWNKYIDGIIDCRKKNLYGYSDKDSDFSGYIGVGETYGFAMGYYMANQKFGTSLNLENDSHWFLPQVTLTLFNDNPKINPINFLNCMNSSCVNLHTLNVYLASCDNFIDRTLYVK